MVDVKVFKGKDVECALYDCPHKKELVKANDELEILSKQNEELNERLETIDNLISQGLTDIKGILHEIFKDTSKIEPEKIDAVVEKIEVVFDTKKITGIVNENLSLRKVIHQKDLKISEIENSRRILEEEKIALQDTLRFKDKQDLNLIKSMRNLDKKAEDQLNLVNFNEAKINEQGLRLKALEEFITEAKVQIKTLREEHKSYLEQNEVLKRENKILGLVQKRSQKALSREVKKSIDLCKDITTLRQSPNGSIWSKVLRRDNDSRSLVLYHKLKDIYYSKLTSTEKQVVVEEFEKVAKLMGE